MTTMMIFWPFWVLTLVPQSGLFPYSGISVSELDQAVGLATVVAGLGLLVYAKVRRGSSKAEGSEEDVEMNTRSIRHSGTMDATTQWDARA
jgi:hypothetical protein